VTNGIISEEMKSRLIRANLPATYEELVALAAGVGIPSDIIINEEGWAQLPTYLSKANLMDDVTEEAIWGDAADRTVNAALKMLADVAYGRVATLNLSVLDTTGAPIPDVTVKLDSPPVVGTDPRTDEDGKITISTNGGQHTLYLVYPMGFTVETANQSVEISGVRDLTLNTAARRANTYTYKITASKNFYIARYLYPIKLDIRGAGGGGCVSVGYSPSTDGVSAQGGAGGYATLENAINTPGKLIRVSIGAAGPGGKVSPTGGSSGQRGGTTTVRIDEEVYSASGGAGGRGGTSQNTDGGSAGGAGADRNNSGEDGQRLFGKSATERVASGGGGAWVGNYTAYRGEAGVGGGTDGYAYYNSSSSYTVPNAKNASGGGGLAMFIGSQVTGTNKAGDGGPGLVAFKKAV
jgi:hypothetical protein